MKIEWKMIRKLLLLILIGQIPEINAQDLNTIDEGSKTSQETKIEEKTVKQPQVTIPVISETIRKHGMEFSISKIISEKDLNVQDIISLDDLESVEEQNKEYFEKKYLNKEVVVIGSFKTISRYNKNYELNIVKFNPNVFSSSLSCSFTDTRDLSSLLQMLDSDSYYVLVKGTVSSLHSLKNCNILGVAKCKI